MKETQKTFAEGQVPLFPKGIDLKPHKTIRIAVSGDVFLNKLETRIIDTPDFQRLRDIKALGTTYLVYPTAVHSRFDHSLGTLAISSDMIRAIRDNKHSSEEERFITDDQEQLIRLLALLHDIGHIPFGHTLEDECCIFPRHDKDHERIDFFLGNDSDIGKIIIDYIGKELYERFMRIFKINKDKLDDLGEDFFIYDIVNNTVCADLLDYLRRDCYFCNLNLDTDFRFLKFIYILKEKGSRKLVVRLWKENKPISRRDLLSDLIRLLDNRYLLGERVYFHHAKLISGAMIAGAVQRAIMEKELKKTDMYKLGDSTLIEKLINSKNPYVKKLASSIRSRYLWKKIDEKSRDDIDTEQTKVRNINLINVIKKRWWEDPSNRTREEDQLSDLLGMDPGDILIHCPDPKMAMKLAEMKVIWNGKLMALKDCEDDPIVGDKLKVILRSHENLWGIRVFINPEHLTKENEVRNGCQYLFTFEPISKKLFGESFWRNVIDEITFREEIGSDLLHPEFSSRAKNAVNHLTSHTLALRKKEDVIKIIKDAFSP